MPTTDVDSDLWQLVLQADALGIRLEVVGGVPLWEPSPVRRHQRTVDAIRSTIRPRVAPNSRACVAAPSRFESLNRTENRPE